MASAANNEQENPWRLLVHSSSWQGDGSVGTVIDWQTADLKPQGWTRIDGSHVRDRLIGWWIWSTLDSSRPVHRTQVIRSQVKFPLTVHCSHHILHSPWRRLGIYELKTQAKLDVEWTAKAEMWKAEFLAAGKACTAVFWLSLDFKGWTSDSVSVICSM